MEMLSKMKERVRHNKMRPENYSIEAWYLETEVKLGDEKRFS